MDDRAASAAARRRRNRRGRSSRCCRSTAGSVEIRPPDKSALRGIGLSHITSRPRQRQCLQTRSPMARTMMANDPAESASGCPSAKSQAIGMACRANTCTMTSILAIVRPRGKRRLRSRSVRLTAKPKIGRDRVARSLGIGAAGFEAVAGDAPAAMTSRSTRSRASMTRSLKRGQGQELAIREQVRALRTCRSLIDIDGPRRGNELDLERSSGRSTSAAHFVRPRSVAGNRARRSPSATTAINLRAKSDARGLRRARTRAAPLDPQATHVAPFARPTVPSSSRSEARRYAVPDLELHPLAAADARRRLTMIGDDPRLLAFLLAEPPRRTSGISIPQAGFGQVTVRAQIQAMTVASIPSGKRRLRVEVRRCASRPRRASTRRRRGRRRRARSRPPSCRSRLSARPGNTGGWSRELRRDLDQRLVDEHRDRVEVGGVRLQAEALGLERDRAAAGERVEDRRRVAVGRLEDLLRAPRRAALVAGVLPDDEPLDDAVQPLALGALSSSVGNRSGCEDGSSTSWANSTARAAASGRRAHHRCSVDGWPWRIDFSRADSRLIASSGSATSISLRFGAPTASSFDRSLIDSERLPRHAPRSRPSCRDGRSRRSRRASKRRERVLEVADLVVLGAARVDAHERQAVARARC